MSFSLSGFPFYAFMFIHIFEMFHVSSDSLSPMYWLIINKLSIGPFWLAFACRSTCPMHRGALTVQSYFICIQVCKGDHKKARCRAHLNTILIRHTFNNFHIFNIYWLFASPLIPLESKWRFAQWSLTYFFLCRCYYWVIGQFQYCSLNLGVTLRRWYTEGVAGGGRVWAINWGGVVLGAKFSGWFVTHKLWATGTHF